MAAREEFERLLREVPTKLAEAAELDVERLSVMPLRDIKTYALPDWETIGWPEVVVKRTLRVLLQKPPGWKGAPAFDPEVRRVYLHLERIMQEYWEEMPWLLQPEPSDFTFDLRVGHYPG
jgi:hypothetical protein